MAGNIKGITIEIGGNTQKLQDSLKGVNSKSRDLQSELREVDRLLKLDPKNTELLAQKQKLLAEAVGNTKEKLDTLKEAERQVKEQFEQGKVGEEQYRAIQREVIKAQEELKKLEGNLSSLNDKWKDAAEKIGNFGSKAEELGKKVTPVSAAAGAVGAGMIAMAVKAGKAADDINTLSKQTGLATDTIQKFQMATDIIDVPLETMTGSLSKLTKNMYSAYSGSEKMQDAFNILGVSVTDINGDLRNNEEVFYDTIEALGRLQNETERDAIAMQIFGKSAQDLNPLILGGADALKKMGAEAEAAGLILSQDALDAANAFNDEIDSLKATAGATFMQMGVQIGQALLPALQSLVEGAKKVLEWMRGLDQTTLKWIITIAGLVAAIAPALIIIGQMATGISAVMKVVTLLTPAMSIFGTTTAAAGVTAGTTAGSVGVLQGALTTLTGPIGIVIAAVAALIAIFIYLWNTNEDFRNKVIELWEGLKNFLVATLDFIKEYFGFAWEAISKAFSAFGKLFKGDFKGFLNDIFNAAKIWVTGWLEIGKNIVTGIWEGILAMKDWLFDKIGGFFGGILDKAKGVLGISSPSKVFAEVIGKNMALGVGVGFEEAMEDVKGAVGESLRSTTQEVYSDNRITNSQEIKVTQNIYAPVKSERAMQKESVRNLRKLIPQV